MAAQQRPVETSLSGEVSCINCTSMSEKGKNCFPVPPFRCIHQHRRAASFSCICQLGKDGENGAKGIGLATSSCAVKGCQTVRVSVESKVRLQREQKSDRCGSSCTCRPVQRRPPSLVDAAWLSSSLHQQLPRQIFPLVQ